MELDTYVKFQNNFAICPKKLQVKSQKELPQSNKRGSAFSCIKYIMKITSKGVTTTKNPLICLMTTIYFTNHQGSSSTF